MLVHEVLVYNRFGLRYVSPEERKARTKFALTHEPRLGEKLVRSLSQYDDGKRSLHEMAVEQRDESLKRLKQEYGWTSAFPFCPEAQRYQRKKEFIKETYHQTQQEIASYNDTEALICDIKKAAKGKVALSAFCILVGVAEAMFARSIPVIGYGIKTSSISIFGFGSAVIYGLFALGDYHLTRQLIQAKHKQKEMILHRQDDSWQKAKANNRCQTR